MGAFQSSRGMQSVKGLHNAYTAYRYTGSYFFNYLRINTIY